MVELCHAKVMIVVISCNRKEAVVEHKKKK